MSLPESYLLNIERWRADTVRMHHKWRGPYMDLCLSIFLAGGSVPNVPQDLAFKARLTGKQFDVFWPAVKDLFLVSGSEVRHAVSSENRANWDDYVAKQRKKGSDGGKKTQENHRKAKAAAKAIESDKIESPPDPPERYSEEFGRLLSAAHLKRWCQPESLKAVRDALVGFDGVTFAVSDRCESRVDWDRIVAHVELCRYRLELSEQRVLSLEDFRKRES